MATPADFFRNLLPYARRVSELTGVDPRLVLAQSALETGYGRSAPGQNYFGIKAPAGQGQGLLTQEFEGGQMVQRREPFRTYESPAQSFEDYANLLLQNERYRPVREARTIEDQIRAMGSSGYATDPEYANKLRSIAMGIDLNDPSLIASDAMGAIGRGPDTSSMMATTEARPAMNGRQMTPGLLAQDAAATAQPMPAQPQAPGRDYGNLLDALAIGFSGMSMRPNEGLIRLAQERIRGRRETAQTTAQRNATADWLESQGMTQQAEAVRRGVLTGAEALQMARGGEATAAQRNYEFLISQGVEPETAMQRAFAGGMTINVPGAGGMSEEGYKAIVKREAAVSEAGMNAQRSLGLVNALESQLAQAPQGAGGVFISAAGNLGLEFDGTSAVQAADALINQLVPAQRPPGSGQMSDADLALFKRSLPRLINTPEGNRRIIETMREMLNYDIQRGQIADQVLLGTMTPQEANQAYMELGNPLGWLREGIGAEQPAQPSAGSEGAVDGVQWRLVD